jgi:hypothetical protein
MKQRPNEDRFHSINPVAGLAFYMELPKAM